MKANLRAPRTPLRGVIVLALLAVGRAWGQEPSPPPPPGPAIFEPPPAAPVPEAPPPRGPFAGMGMGGGMGGPGMGPPGYRAAWYPSQRVEASTASLGLIREGAAGAVPLWKADGELLLLTASVRNTLFFTDAVLPDTGRRFPDALWNVSLGLMHRHQFDNGWEGALSLSLGSASDRPFHGLEEMQVNVFASLKVPVRDGPDAWVFSLMYSPAGNIPFPIPGIAYSWRPDETLQMMIGLPFSITWRPAADWSFSFLYVPVINITSQVSYRVSDGVSVYGGFEWLNEAYFLADRADRRDRFLAFEKRLITGVRWGVCRYATLDLNAGYAFDRYYGEGQSQLGDLSGRVDVASGAFLGANVTVKW